MAKITFSDGKMIVPETVTIPFIEGDGIGPDITGASRIVFDEAVKKVYNGKRKVEWLEIYAGEKAYKKFGTYLPDETFEKIKEYKVAIKGPLTTPVGGGFRSLNVTLRQTLDLYANVRPVRYLKGVPAPVCEPEKVDMVIFRENTDDIYLGIEWPAKSDEALKVIEFLEKEMGVHIEKDSGIGIKPMSERKTKRLVRMAIRYAVEKKRKKVTLVHKGNIMKYTEGAFRDWGYEVAEEEFSQYVKREQEEKDVPIIINDRIADAMFQQVLLRPAEYDVLALPNLNGDYISDALLAQVGGIGLGPGANIGDEVALFEPTHGTAPKYANKNMVNPGALILTGAMMFEYLGWDEVKDAIISALEKTITEKIVTYDLARLMDGAKKVGTREFAEEVAKRI